jgi:dihydrofolate synthase/folylpolyglutamate synthase
MSRPYKTLKQWLEYIESLHPSHIELGLDRVAQVADRLGVRRFSAPVITVTGTNGKGSAIAAMEAIGRHKGLVTAAYTSPHLLTFNERLRINGKELQDNLWCEAFQQVENARGEIELTYFEFTTLAAFHLIKNSKIDLILLEVGLGGRLDAVNIVDNQCAVITSIDYDHQEWLGETLEQIAYEKAGICRDNSPVVVANSQIAALVQPNIPCSSHLTIALQEIKQYRNWNTELVEKYGNTLYPDSLACAIVALKLIGIHCDELDDALSLAQLPGRWQQLSFLPNWWFDVAHNPQAIENLARKLTRETRVKQWRVICGMLRDKRAIESMSHLQPLVKQWLLVPTTGPRGQSSEQLAQKLSQLNLSEVTSCSNERQAVEACLNNAEPETGILVFGSFIVVANVIEYLQQQS